MILFCATVLSLELLMIGPITKFFYFDWPPFFIHVGIMWYSEQKLKLYISKYLGSTKDQTVHDDKGR